MSEDITLLTNPTWVTREHFEKLTGIPASTIRGWQARHLTRGIHFQVIGRLTLINQEEFNSWLSQLGPATSTPLETDLESESNINVRPIKKQSPALTHRKLISKQRSLREIE